jgi:hypothetical protein
MLPAQLLCQLVVLGKSIFGCEHRNRGPGASGKAASQKMGIVESCCVDDMLLQWLVFNERLGDVRIHSLLLLSSITGCNTLCRVTIVLNVEDKFNVLAVCESESNIQG